MKEVKVLIFLILIATLAAACAPMYPRAEQVESEPPSVTYEYNSDAGLLEANNKARDYCAQYASTPSIQGTIRDNGSGEHTVEFQCIKTAAVVLAPDLQVYPAPPAQPTGYVYSTDSQLLAAMQSADAYCGQSGLSATTSIDTNPYGAKTLNFRCVP